MTTDKIETFSGTLYNADLEEPALLRWVGGDICWYSRRSPSKQTPNEDSAAVICVDSTSAVFLVADGCGGMAGGERASRVAVETLATSVDRSEGPDSLRPAVLDGIEAANREVQAIGSGAATTLAAVELRDRTIRPYHVGDSTVLLVGNRGKIKLQTRSHAPVAYGVEAGLIHADDAIHHEDLHLVSNVVGSSDTHIEIGSERTMSRRDTLLIASDGLFDNLYTEEIVEIVRKGKLLKAARSLAEQVCQRMVSPAADEPTKPDDITFVLFRCGA